MALLYLLALISEEVSKILERGVMLSLQQSLHAFRSIFASAVISLIGSNDVFGDLLRPTRPVERALSIAAAGLELEREVF